MTRKIEHQHPTSYIKHLAVRGLSSVSARIKSSCNLTGKCFEMPNVSYSNRYQQAKKKDNDSMAMKFLLHKYKNGNPPHIQAHLAAPTHGRPLRSQKSLHFAYTPLKDSDLFE